ncbi:MAG: addiction module toxin, HicA family [Microcystis panniformis]|jgi:predicted RNA binding protein YcfA (HicA-like mRNA interferase family)|uniref:addiction module toxin, HicA family n=1 Tax=Microcystis TaxID=1125 RepID=UPI000E372D07|nr:MULTISPECIES: addiction module toxin, HicA family [Microcystis]REJ52520.1 MAG: addiction module toxin, HicA family [Microcystis aeruginosa TA09]
MSVKRRDLVRYLEENSFYLLREGGNHSIYDSIMTKDKASVVKTLQENRYWTF